MKPWTKKQIKSMTSALDSFVLINRPLVGSFSVNAGAQKSFAEWVGAVLADPANRKQAICSGIRELRGIYLERAERNADSAQHARQHPTVWGSSTEEMIARFEQSEADERKAIAWADKLLAKIDADGLPQDVLVYDPCRQG